MAELIYLFSSDELSKRLLHKGVEWKYVCPQHALVWEILGTTHKSHKVSSQEYLRTNPCNSRESSDYHSQNRSTSEWLATYTCIARSKRPRTNQPSPFALWYENYNIVALYSWARWTWWPDFGDVPDLQTSKSPGIRWKCEYLTALRETFKVTGNNEHRVKIGDVVLIHEDKPRIMWKLAVIKGVNKGADGLIRSADIQTTTCKTNWPIAPLYPLEVTASENAKRTTSQTNNTKLSTSSAIITDKAASPNRPVHDAAKKQKEQIKQWAILLRDPTQDIMDSDKTLNHDLLMLYLSIVP